MNQEQIIELVREAGGMADYMTWVERDLLPVFERFAALVAAAEREECAKLCDYVYDNIVTDEHIKDMAFKIRARGDTK
jgi:hypothetical protein